MKACKSPRCNRLIGAEHYFCPTHRDTDYAKEYRLRNGGNQP